MKYAFLIYDDEKSPLVGTPDLLKDYGVFTEEVMSKDLMRSAERLQRTDSATTVRVRDGKALTVDGPFAETKEQLGGFYILDCKDLDEALTYAAKIPSARNGSIEVRPIWEM
ncbi:MAG TPA: YciI family protein [Dehalococcoidia bacterium]|jgi:hypothetical protein